MNEKKVPVPIFSRRTSWELSKNSITRTFEDLRQSKIQIIDLTESNPTRCQFSYSNKILETLSDPRNLIYQPSSQGMLEAREAIAKSYARKGFEITPDQIFLTASTSEGYSYLFRLLADCGDKVLFPRPSYPLFQFLADLNDVEIGFFI